MDETKVVKLAVKYELGRTYQQALSRENSVFCPECGHKGVWTEMSEGDYYVGPTSYCAACGMPFTLQLGGRSDEETDSPDAQIVAAIRLAEKEAKR